MFGKSDRMTWSSERIARSEKFSKKSSYAFSSRNLTESRREGVEEEEEEEEPRRLIEFLEGKDFLGAMRRKLN